MDKKSIEAFDSVLYGVSERLAKILFLLPCEIKAKAQEIRIRNGKALALTVEGRPVFVRADSSVSHSPGGSIKSDKKDLEESFRLLCRSSVFSHLREIKNGFIIMKGGHRAGVSGTFSPEGGIAFISSVNIRIAKEFFGAADFIAENYNGGGVLIAGPPGSGKTTVLRDLIRMLSGGKFNKYYKVSVVDTRGEISASFEGVAYNDLGDNTDILLGTDKITGTEIALRTLFPDYIAFDEIGNLEELLGVSQCMASGVDIITTAHVGDKSDLLKREITSRLLKLGAIKTVAVLNSPAGSGACLLDAQEVTENCGY